MTGYRRKDRVKIPPLRDRRNQPGSEADNLILSAADIEIKTGIVDIAQQAHDIDSFENLCFRTKNRCGRTCDSRVPHPARTIPQTDRSVNRIFAADFRNIQSSSADRPCGRNFRSLQLLSHNRCVPENFRYLSLLFRDIRFLRPACPACTDTPVDLPNQIRKLRQKIALLQ